MWMASSGIQYNSNICICLCNKNMCVCNENMCADNKTYVFRPDWTWWCWRWPPCRWGAPRTPGWPARTPRSRGPRAQTPGSEIRVGMVRVRVQCLSTFIQYLNIHLSPLWAITWLLILVREEREGGSCFRVVLDSHGDECWLRWYGTI